VRGTRRSSDNQHVFGINGYDWEACEDDDPAEAIAFYMG
jgi:hypothetical protein